ncbi:MAG: hypothetical protein ACE365_00550 [Gammaproteobacteria bacterium]
MKKLSKTVFAISVIAASTTCIAGAYNGQMAEQRHWAGQGAVTTDGASLGLVYYGDVWEMGVTGAGKYDNDSDETRLFTPAIFAGRRINLAENTEFAYGLGFSSKFGKDDGEDIDSAYGAGPYISLEQHLTPNLILSAWVEPYYYEYEKKDGDSTTTHSFFSTGGIALSYLFA